MIWNTIHKITKFGTEANLPPSLNKQIELCNQIALLLIIQALVFMVANSLFRFDTIKILTSIVNVLIYILILTLNKYKKHTLARFVVSVVIPITLLGSQIIARTVNKHEILITQYFGDRVIIVACMLFPLLLFNSKREKFFFRFTYLFLLMCLFLYDPVHIYLGIDVHRANIPHYLKGYSFINITFAIVVASITLSIIFLKSLNLKFEKQLLENNTMLIIQKEEILTQNEELQQTHEELKTQRDYIEVQHSQIKSSLNTAQTIQNAILPTSIKLKEILQNHFVMYLPRDVVSGDFYWVHKIEQTKILVVADCTGHGIPGAFMTLISHTLLDKIIIVWQITEPADILQKLHEEVRKVLQQNIYQNNMGMDALVITWETFNAENIALQFEGAKLDMLYILPEKQAIQQLKGTRRAIGGDQNEKKAFLTQKLILPKSTQIYVGSDGLADQNNVNRKSFGNINLQSVLLKNAHLSLDTQKDNIYTVLQNYSTGTQQRDDILWIGFELIN